MQIFPHPKMFITGNVGSLISLELNSGVYHNDIIYPLLAPVFSIQASRGSLWFCIISWYHWKNTNIHIWKTEEWLFWIYHGDISFLAPEEAASWCSSLGQWVDFSWWKTRVTPSSPCILGGCGFSMLWRSMVSWCLGCRKASSLLGFWIFGNEIVCWYI